MYHTPKFFGGIMSAIACASILTSSVAVAETATQRGIDVANSKAQFNVSHIFVEHVTGTIPIQSGFVTLAAGSLVPISATAVLDASKVATDEPDRDSSLRSDDFFDVAKFPTWTFVSTKITPHGTNAFDMDGNLTVHGVTQPEHLTVTISGDAEHPKYHATGQIDRHAFGMRVTTLDPTIGGNADITLDVTLK